MCVRIWPLLRSCAAASSPEREKEREKKERERRERERRERESIAAWFDLIMTNSSALRTAASAAVNRVWVLECTYVESAQEQPAEEVYLRTTTGYCPLCKESEKFVPRLLCQVSSRISDSPGLNSV